MSQGSFLVSTGSSTGGSAAKTQQQQHQQQQHEADDSASGDRPLIDAGGCSRDGDSSAVDEDVIHLDPTGTWGQAAMAQFLSEQARQAEDGGGSASPGCHHVNSDGGWSEQSSHPSGVSGGSGGQGPFGPMDLLQSVELMSGFDGALMADLGDLDDSGDEFYEEGEEGEEGQGLSPNEPGEKMRRAGIGSGRSVPGMRWRWSDRK